jgi:pseudouridine-5'-phosphate glycosidase
MIAPKHLRIHPEVHQAIRTGKPVVALESAVITHGLPYPENMKLALATEEIIRQGNATPATVAVIHGVVQVGLAEEQLIQLSKLKDPRKISKRDFGVAIAQKLSGGTTVAGTMIAAHLAGIQVFSTGGIGGVHRDSYWDISADLPELSQTPMVVVCSGPKAILDLSATMEYLETSGVIVIGYQTDELPAFYTRHSGILLDTRMDDPFEIVSTARVQWEMGINSAILVTQPPPRELEPDAAWIEDQIQMAIKEAHLSGIHGPSMTPFLLDRMNFLTRGASLQTNLALLKQNARLAAEIACALSGVVNEIQM